MTDWRTRLRDADRALDRDVEPEVSQRIRRAVLAAVPARPVAAQAWSRTFTATAAVLTLVCVALLTTLQGGARLSDDTAVRVDSADTALASTTDDVPATERQQLHFSTPGGTRIIWVFDPGFEVKGTLP